MNIRDPRRQTFRQPVKTSGLRAVRKAPQPKPPAKAKYALFALGSVLAVTVAMAWNPPTQTVHGFTTASDYNATKESGCTNSGEGCHGAETEYTDFNAYHPDTDCTSCHEYEGVGCIPCHSPREHECALCHDGSMKNAPDRVRITDPYPHGHYRETTHTATATDMKAVVKASEDGEAQASCKECHSRDLKAAHTAVPAVDGSPYGSDIGCGECHNDVRAFGQAEVLSDWKSRTCEACHGVDSSSPMHSSTVADPVEATDAGCSDTGVGCHDSTDLHALHADAPKNCSGSASKGEPGCHDLDIESHLPTAKSCGGDSEDDCHRGSNGSEYQHENMVASHGPTTGVAASGVYEGERCGSCHYMAPGTASLITEHARATSAMSGVGTGCVRCHNNVSAAAVVADGWTERETSASCSACHSGDGIQAAHTRDLTAAHLVVSGSEGCANSGAGCHPTSSLADVGTSATALHSSCLRCHATDSSNGNAPYDPTKKTCGSGRDCHNGTGEFEPTSGMHTISGTAVGGTDARSHTAGQAQLSATLVDEASGVVTACTQCHSGVLGTEHRRSNATSAIAGTCVSCHNANAAASAVVKAGWPTKDTARACAGCHAGSAAPAPHTDIDTAHRATEYGRDGTPLAGSCARAGCHTTADVRVVHAELGCTFAGCHSNRGDIRGLAVMSCGGIDDERACHAGSARHATRTTKHLATEIDRYGNPVPGSCLRAGCHATTDVRTLHETTHCETAGCHVEGGPTLMTCGGSATTEGSCHAGSARHSQASTKHLATEIDRYGNPVPGSCLRAGCHATTDVRTLHETTHCETAGCHVEGGPTLMTCGGSATTEGSCHAGSARHSQASTKHLATEIDRYGNPVPGSCLRAGCHATTDVRTLHETTHCETAGCHVEGGPTLMTCGGSATTEGSCHAGSARHSQASTKHLATEIDRYGNPVPGSCLRAGCHATTDVRTLHETTHCETAGCHVEGGPTLMTCGGSATTEGSCHAGSARHSQASTKHLATEIDRYGNPVPGSCLRAGCHATTDVRTLHETTHCETAGCHVEGGPTLMTCGGSATTEGSCHAGSARHSQASTKHLATERTPDGTVTPGACATTGCHATTDVRTLHETTHCETAGCHVEGGPTNMGCGGQSGDAACHIGFGPTDHNADHSTDLNGTVGGITYGPGENVGCIGTCHATGLVAEHSARLGAGTLEGGGANVCSICHSAADGSGAYASSPAVTAAIASGDKRCIACHASGSSIDSAQAVASPPSTCLPSASIQASTEPLTTPVAESLLLKSAIPTPADPASEAPEQTEEKRDSTDSTGSTPPAQETSNTPDVKTPPTTDDDEDAQPTPPEPPAEQEPASEEECEREPSDETTEAPTIKASSASGSECLDCHEIRD